MNQNVPWTYPLIMFASLALGVALSRGRQTSLGLSPTQRLAIGLGAFCGAMIGAKLPFAISDWHGLLSGRVWIENGKTIVFGMVGGYFGVELAKAITNVKVKTGDSFAVPVAAAVAVGRLSCFVAGCCHGITTSLPWGVDFGDGVRRHPTQIYESIFHTLCALGLARLERKGMFKGQLIKLYIITYLFYRFVTEWIRPEPIFAIGLTAYQWSCLAFLPVFAALWVKDARSTSAVVVVPR